MRNFTQKIKDLQNDKKHIETLELQNNKIENPQGSKFTKKSKYPFFTLVKLHNTKLKTPKMTRRKLETLELQNIKVKTLQSS